MRITYLHQYFNTPSMKGGTRSYEMARRLVAAGHEVNMVTSDRERSGKPYQTEEAGINVTWIPVKYANRMGAIARMRAFADFAWRSSRIAAGIPSDVVFATSTPLTIAIPGVFASRRRRVPMVFEVRDLWPEMPIAMGVLKDPISKFLARKLERFAYRNAAHIVALSPGMKDGVVKQGYPESQVTVIPNACDVELFDVDRARGQAFRAKYDWLGDRPLVVYAGTIGPVNGVEYLADLANETRKFDPNVRFLVVGNGKAETNVREHAQNVGVLDQNFFMIPGVEKLKMPDILSAADIAMSLFIPLPEMEANSANKFFDALASGTPVAINYLGWQAQLLLEHNIGVLLDGEHMANSSRVLLDFMTDSERLEHAKQQMRMLASQRFNRDALACELARTIIGSSFSGLASCEAH